MGLREILFVQIRELLLSECIDIKSSLGDYTIEVCDQQRIFSIEDHDSHFYLLDSIVADLYYGSSLRHSHIHKLEASEKNKTLLFVMEVIEWLRNAGATRQSKLVVVGGGDGGWQPKLRVGAIKGSCHICIVCIYIYIYCIVY